MGLNARRKANKKLFRKKDKKYSLPELESYYRAAYAIYREIVAERPAAIIAPLRGAYPIIKTIQLFASLEGKSSQIPAVFYPKIGEVVKEQGKEKMPEKFSKIPERALGEKEARREVSRIIDKIAKLETSKKRKTILIVDEVIQGGSVSKTMKLLDDLISEKGKNFSVKAAVLSDARFEKCMAFHKLCTQKRVKEYALAKLFTVDSSHFVPELVSFRKFFLGTKQVKLVPTKRSSDGRMQLLRDLERMKKRLPIH